MITKIVHSAHCVVLDCVCVDVEEETVDGQISAIGVFEGRSDGDGGNAALVVVFLFPQIHKVNTAVIYANCRCFEMFGLHDNSTAVSTLSGLARIFPMFEVLYPCE